MADNHYLVRWDINIDAEGPVAAARKAQAIQRKADSAANVFEVFEDGVGMSMRIDLDTSVIQGMQVIPICEKGDEVTPQFSGPDEFTTGWAVYARLMDGTVEWQADMANEDFAMMLGIALAKKYDVMIEPQLWKNK